MKAIRDLISNCSFLKRMIPRRLKSRLRASMPLQAIEYARDTAGKADPYADESIYGEYDGSSKYRLGIIREFTHYHQYYVAACRELNVSYKLIDITASNWIERIEDSGCDGFLVWPSALLRVWRQMYDERLRVMVNEMGKVIFPGYDELWMWESKRRMRDWLIANDIPTPRTWIFYDYAEAMDFTENTELPIVFKTNHGDCSKGVRILRRKREVKRFVDKVFKVGLNLNFAHKCNAEWGNIVFQEYLPEAIEWRLIRIGDSYFGYMKKKIGDYASGSHAGVYADIPRHLLDFTRDITDRLELRSMSFDTMVNPDGSPLVIEAQSIFGDTADPRKLRVDGKPGRYVYDESEGKWRFEEGIFDQNICCNLRVECLLDSLGHSDRRG